LGFSAGGTVDRKEAGGHPTRRSRMVYSKRIGRICDILAAGEVDEAVD
jgi:hypothetical protein